MTCGSLIFTSWFQIISGIQRSQLEFVLWWCDHEQSLNSFDEHHRIFISNLIMSNILAKAEKSRLTNVFQAFAMNIYESILTCL